MTDAEKVVKALREMQCECVGCYKDDDWVREHNGECKAMHALADFVLAASVVYDECGMVGCPSNGSMEKQGAALARLREVLGE